MGEKETMSGDALRESPTRASTGRGPAASSVGQLGGGAASAASYAREAADGPELATEDSDGDAPESDAAKTVTKTSSNIQNN